MSISREQYIEEQDLDLRAQPKNVQTFLFGIHNLCMALGITEEQFTDPGFQIEKNVFLTPEMAVIEKAEGE